MASVVNKELAYGDEELITELDRHEERARLSHYDGSHAFPQLTYNQRIELGSMMLEMAGDI
jgi:hypothetical protein